MKRFLRFAPLYKEGSIKPGEPPTEDLEDLYENAPCGYLSIQPDGRISKTNATFAAWMEYAPEQLLGKRLHDLLNVAGRIFYETHFAPLLRMQGFFNEVALDFVTQQGRRLPVLVNAAERRNEGRHLSTRLTVFNATDRRRYERELVEARAAAEAAGKRLQEFNATLEACVESAMAERDRVWRHSRDLQVMIDADRVLRTVSPAWTRMLGHRTEEVIGRSVLEFIHPEHVGPTKEALQAAASGKDLTSFENRLLHKDSSSRWVSWHTAVEGGVIYAYGRDITVEKVAQAELAGAQDALRQSQKMEAVGQLTGGLAHDFNNLLAAISGSLELLQTRMQQGRIAELDRYIVAAHEASKRAASLTHRLLAFSRRQTLDSRPTNVNRLVAEMEELVRRTVGPAITVEVVGAGGLWTALVDPNQLENALLNLCINARDAMPDGGRLTIETANRWLDERGSRERDLIQGQYLSLCVSDTGCGMTPEVIARAFDPFFTTKPIGMGTGLGLSMIHGFARQSGGQVRIYSEVGQGSMVCIYLPRYSGTEGEIEAASDPSVVPQEQHGETVLVVDDEPAVRMLVAEVVAELGYHAIEAPDGVAALKVLQSDVRIDLLVTDVGLPRGMNGRQLADAARPLRPVLKVLFITGYAENAVVGHGHLEPWMNVLTKPFGMAALANRIRSILGTKL